MNRVYTIHQIMHSSRANSKARAAVGQESKKNLGAALCTAQYATASAILFLVRTPQ